MGEPLTEYGVRGVTRESVVDEVAASVRADVLSGVYAPGEYLPPARELAEAYGVTRTSLKHALVRLAESGLVETKHGVGTRVRDYERHGGIDLLPMLVNANIAGWAQSVFEVRTEIGAVVAVRAAAHATTQQRQELAAKARELGTARTPDEAQLAECEWHRRLAAATGNRVYPLLMNVVLDGYLQQRAALRGPFLDPAAAAERLRPLADAVSAGQAADIVHGLATDYLTETGQLMIESLTEQGVVS